MDYLNLAIKAACLAGEAIMKVYESANFNVEYKADNSPLTKADRNAHDKIIEILQESNLPVLSEEGNPNDSELRLNWDTFWMVDPLDGTKEFIKRNGEFTVNIALINKGIPVLGVVYAPVLMDLYYGDIENGAFKAGIHLQNNGELVLENMVSLPQALPDVYTIVASRSHMNQETSEIITEKEQLYGQVNIISKGSSLKLCLVAEGSAHYYPRLAPTMEWDTAAGHAIATAAGCQVLNYNTKQPLAYNKEDLLNPWFEVIRE